MHISQSRSSDGKFLYLFNHVRACNDYILYTIDVFKHLENNPSTVTHLYHELHPLLVFPEPLLPSHCVCAKMGSTFYFICGMLWQPSFGFQDSKDTDVYIIKEMDLIDIHPSELNVNAKDYLIKSVSMNGGKHLPSVFVVQNKLYVLSVYPSDTQFEVFSCDSNSWRVLPPQPDGYGGRVTCYVVVGKTVYFTINRCVLLSFNVEEEKWGILTPNNQDVVPSLSFASPLVIMGGKGFGFLHDEGDPSLLSLTICAIPLPDDNGDVISYDSFLPSIAPDDEFKRALDSSRCPRVTEKSYENFSESIVALDGGKIMCVVSYGIGPELKDSWRSFDPYTSYVTLTFFEDINCDTEKVAGEDGLKRYFKAKYLHSAQFVIKTTSLRTCGRMRACLF